MSKSKPFSEGLYATQDYLNTAPTVLLPDDLEHHTLLMSTKSLEPSTRNFVRGKTSRTVMLAPKYVTNEALPILQAVLLNSGIAVLPSFVGDTQVMNKRLKKVLPEWELPKVELNALTPSFKGEVPAVREYLQMAKAMFKQTTTHIGSKPAP